MKDDVTDDEIEKLEEELKKLESTDTTYGSPKPAEKDSLFKFFRNILNTQDTTRVGNLNNTELGQTKLGVRAYQELAAYARAEDLPVVAAYLSNKSQIVSSTSMARKGFWSQLFVTQIKRESKEKPKKEEPKKWFGGNKAEAE